MHIKLLIMLIVLIIIVILTTSSLLLVRLSVCNSKVIYCVKCPTPTIPKSSLFPYLELLWKNWQVTQMLKIEGR